MKIAFKKLGAALGAATLLAATGCDSIRDYSVNSYQGIMPVADMRPTGAMPPTTIEVVTVAPAAPLAVPAAEAPAAAPSPAK